MKILVINGDCIEVNSSANLCHLAYIKGLLAAGHEVTLLSADGRDYVRDPSMTIPKEVRCYTYYGVSLYEKFALLKKKAGTNKVTAGPDKKVSSRTSFKRKAVKYLKKAVLNTYGIHGIYAKFVRKAFRFRSEEVFDCVLSLSTPVTSHLLAYKLISKGHVKCCHWVQLWEDPWYSDAYGFNTVPRVFKEERKILNYAERICYVSPLTLAKQKKLFPEAGIKMFWAPVPAYYMDSEEEPGVVMPELFGYFGAYYPSARNLAPFYEAAVKTGIEVNICGDPHSLFSANEKIHIHPRLTLDELRPIEQKTGILVFLCNRQGGQIPGKIYQYAATSKTILFILDGTDEEKKVLRGFFEPYERFVFCDNTVEDISHVIRKILMGDLGCVKNRPLTAFEPRMIINRILEEGMSIQNE